MARRHEPRAVATPATLALVAAGFSFTPHTYEHDPTAASLGLEAAHGTSAAIARR